MDGIRADNQRNIESTLAAVFAPTIQSLYTATQTDNMRFIVGGATKYLLTAGMRTCAWKPKRKTARPICTDPVAPDSKYCKAHKHRCEAEDREKSEADAHKKYKRKYLQAKGRRQHVNDSRSSSTSDSEDEVEILSRNVPSNFRVEDVTSTTATPRSSSKSSSSKPASSSHNAMTTEQTLQERNRELEMRLQQMEQMLQRMQPQPQQQPPRPNDSLDGIDKQLRATTINSPPQQDADGDVNIGEEDQNPLTV